MQIILNKEEAWALMMLLSSQVMDGAELSEDGKAAIRRWRSNRNMGDSEMDDLTIEFNEALGTVLDERMRKLLRRGSMYISSDDELRR